MSRAAISVALCTYNGERYLTEQLASISAQTLLPDEVVVCDDASTDGTLAIVEQFAQQSPFPVRVRVNQQNIGSTKNFESAIRLCEGDIIVLSDQDDVWKSHKIERLVGHLHDHPARGFVFSDAVCVNENRIPLGYTLWRAIAFTHKDRERLGADTLFFELLRRNVVTGAAMAFRSQFRSLVLPIPETWVHDAWIAMIISAVANGGWIDEPLIEYRQHGSQQIGDKLRTLYHEYRVAQNMTLSTFERGRINFVHARSRLGTMEGVSRHKMEALVDKIVHVSERCAMRCEKGWRFPAVLREAVTGRYSRYSQGWKAICQDLLLQ